MYCKTCGKRIEEGALFCSGCGEKIDHDEKATGRIEAPSQPGHQRAKPRTGAKTAKLIVGIISIVLFVVIGFQSCAVSFGTALTGTESTSGGAGIIVALLMLISGIVGICTRNSKSGGITAGVFYAIAGLLGIGNAADFPDLEIWSYLCLIFAVIYIAGSLKMGRKDRKGRKRSSN